MFKIDPVALSRSGRFGDVRACEKLLLNYGLNQRMPFLLDDGWMPLRNVNEWLSTLPVRRCTSPATWRNYALDLLLWERFLRARGKTALDAEQRDLVAYHAMHRLGDAGVDEIVKSGTWNRWVASLSNYYKWSAKKERIRCVPFEFEDVSTVHDGVVTGTERNMALEKKGTADATVQWLEADYLEMFLNVGLSGFQPDGTPDPEFHGRNATRNRAFAELLASTGMRVQEASCLLAACRR
jgi:site-specific recombinase XerD